MKNKYRILKIIFTVGVFIFLLNFSLNRFSNKEVENVVVNMLQKEAVAFIDEKDIREIVEKSTPNKKIGSVDIPALERKVLAMPMVDSANVYLKLNGELNLDIVQRIPIFRLQKKRKVFYVDEKGNEFPLSKNYSYQCMMVEGEISKSEYLPLVELVKKIDEDKFSRNFFVGISKEGDDYFLLTNDGNYRVELGDLENIDFKIRGFKTFVEKYLIYQAPQKYTKISLKYDNQIVTTLREGVKEEEVTQEANKG